MLPKIPYFVLFRVDRLCNLLLATKLQYIFIYSYKRKGSTLFLQGRQEGARGASVLLPSHSLSLSLPRWARCLWGVKDPSGHHMAVSRTVRGKRDGVKVRLSYISNCGRLGRPAGLPRPSAGWRSEIKRKHAAIEKRTHARNRFSFRGFCRVFFSPSGHFFLFVCFCFFLRMCINENWRTQQTHAGTDALPDAQTHAHTQWVKKAKGL